MSKLYPNYVRRRLVSANPNLKIYDRQQQKLQPWVRTYAIYGLNIQLKTNTNANLLWFGALLI